MEYVDLDYEKDFPIIVDKYLDYLPENVDKKTFLNNLIKTLVSA